jgi:hypothetical protein
VARPVSDSQHGTTTGYAYGCRCARCKGAWTAYWQDYRLANHGRLRAARKARERRARAGDGP